MDQASAAVDVRQNPGNLSPLARRAVVDLGSNSVRLVIFEGNARNPVQIFKDRKSVV